MKWTQLSESIQLLVYSTPQGKLVMGLKPEIFEKFFRQMSRNQVTCPILVPSFSLSAIPTISFRCFQINYLSHEEVKIRTIDHSQPCLNSSDLVVG